MYSRVIGLWWADTQFELLSPSAIWRRCRSTSTRGAKLTVSVGENSQSTWFVRKFSNSDSHSASTMPCLSAVGRFGRGSLGPDLEMIRRLSLLRWQVVVFACSFRWIWVWEGGVWWSSKCCFGRAGFERPLSSKWMVSRKVFCQSLGGWHSGQYQFLNLIEEQIVRRVDCVVLRGLGAISEQSWRRGFIDEIVNLRIFWNIALRSLSWSSYGT